MRGNYVMMPGARLVVGPKGRLEETLGAVDLTSRLISSGTTPLHTATVTGTPPTLVMAPPGMPGMPPGMPPGPLPPGYTPLPPSNIGTSAFSGPDSTLYLVAGAVGIVGLIVFLKRRRAAQGPAKAA